MPLNIVVWDRVNLNVMEILKADTLDNSSYEKFLYFWVNISHKRATNSTGIRANWINCLLYIWKVLLNLHNFPLLNINCTELYLGPLYRSYIMVQILNCRIPERVLLNGAIWKRFSKVSRRWRCAACHLLQVFTRVWDATCGENGPFCVKNVVSPSLVRINIDSFIVLVSGKFPCYLEIDIKTTSREPKIYSTGNAMFIPTYNKRTNALVKNLRHRSNMSRRECDLTCLEKIQF